MLSPHDRCQQWRRDGHHLRDYGPVQRSLGWRVRPRPTRGHHRQFGSHNVARQRAVRHATDIDASGSVPWSCLCSSGARFHARDSDNYVTSPSDATYGDAPITLAAAATSAWPISYAVVSGPGTVSGNVLTITGAGSIVVQANQTGNSDYGPVTTQQTITVNRAPLTLNVNNVSATYGGTIPGLSYNLTGFVNGDNQSVLSGTVVLTTSATSSSPVRTYPINVNNTLSSQNYTISFGQAG